MATSVQDSDSDLDLCDQELPSEKKLKSELDLYTVPAETSRDYTVEMKEDKLDLDDGVDVTHSHSSSLDVNDDLGDSGKAQESDDESYSEKHEEGQESSPGVTNCDSVPKGADSYPNSSSSNAAMSETQTNEEARSTLAPGASHLSEADTNVVDAAAGIQPGADKRIIYFTVKYRDQKVKVTLTDTKTVATLKAQLSMILDVRVGDIVLKGWGNRIVLNNSILRDLHLPTKNKLVMFSRSDRDNQERTYNLQVTFHLGARSELMHLKFPGTKTVAEVKRDAFYMSDIPEKRQKWTGWPDNTDDSMPIGSIGLCFPNHVLEIRSIRTVKTKAAQVPKKKKSADLPDLQELDILQEQVNCKRKSRKKKIPGKSDRASPVPNDLPEYDSLQEDVLNKPSAAKQRKKSETDWREVLNISDMDSQDDQLDRSGNLLHPIVISVVDTPVSDKAKSPAFRKMKRPEPTVDAVPARAKCPEATVQTPQGMLEVPVVMEEVSVLCEACSIPYSHNSLVECCFSHLICKNCVEKSAKSVLTGESKGFVTCSKDNCSSSVPQSELRKALPSMVLDLLEDRFKKEAIEALENMKDLVKCPGCGNPGVLDITIKHFQCHSCGKTYCRFCEMEWHQKSHTLCLKMKTIQTMDSGAGIQIPAHWTDDCNKEKYTTVELCCMSEEFNEIAKQFIATVRKPTQHIQAIHRIQNVRLWDRYSLTRTHMVADLGELHLREMRLFHGTQLKVVDAICKEGFDWRLCGKHGVAYGKGTYFAKNASYSDRYCMPRDPGNSFPFLIPYVPPAVYNLPAPNLPFQYGAQTSTATSTSNSGLQYNPATSSSTIRTTGSNLFMRQLPVNPFSAPNQTSGPLQPPTVAPASSNTAINSNSKYMFVGRVLVGRTCLGHPNMLRPGVDPHDPEGKICNSAVDNLNSPHIFVIFDSAQCYPEYLIQY